MKTNLHTRQQPMDAEEAKKRLLANDQVDLVAESYSAFGKKAVFIDKEYGEFEARPCDVANGKRHPQWWRDHKQEILSEKNRYTLEKAQSLMPEGVEIDPDSYSAYHKKCWLIDREHGKFWSSPKEVGKAGKSLHPKNKNEQRWDKEGSREALGRLRSKYTPEELTRFQKKGKARAAETMLRKYGHESAFAVSEFREKSRQTCQERYGLDYFPVGTVQESQGERELKEWVGELGYQTEKLVDEGFELDIYIPELKIGLEFNGVFWHSDAYKAKSYHSAKTAFFYKKGVRVIHVFECFWVHRQAQVKNFLRSALNRNPTRVGARKCRFEFVPFKDAADFCEKHHIQGSSAGLRCSVGIFLENEMIGCAQFGGGHRQSIKDEYFLKRLCFKDGVTVNGALSKLSRWACDFFEADLFSFVDLTLSQGAGYFSAGWEKESVTKPDYFYSNQKAEYISKQSRKKSNVGTPLEMTEIEHAKIDGLFRIWDCGKIKVRYRSKKNQGEKY